MGKYMCIYEYVSMYHVWLLLYYLIYSLELCMSVNQQQQQQRRMRWENIPRLLLRFRISTLKKSEIIMYIAPWSKEWFHSGNADLLVFAHLEYALVRTVDGMK